jgi:hypothetical protein
MSTKQIVQCDLEGCGKTKGEVNHWFIVTITEGNRFVCMSSENTNSGSPYNKDVCGVEHAQVMFSRFLSNGGLERDTPAKEAVIEEVTEEDDIPF